jgi:hypothetical protein
MEDMKSSEVTDMSTAQPGIRRESTASIDDVAKRRNPMDWVIETVASGMGNTIGFLAETGVLFAIFAILWAAFAVALIWSHGSPSAVSVASARRPYARSLTSLIAERPEPKSSG